MQVFYTTHSPNLFSVTAIVPRFVPSLRGPMDMAVSIEVTLVLITTLEAWGL